MFFQGRLFNELWEHGTALYKSTKLCSVGKYRKTENPDLLGEKTAFQLAVGREECSQGLRRAVGALAPRAWESGGAPWDLKGELQEAGGGPQKRMGR